MRPACFTALFAFATAMTACGARSDLSTDLVGGRSTASGSGGSSTTSGSGGSAGGSMGGLCWWSRSFGGPGLDWLQDGAVSASGAMALTGTLSGPVDLGGVSISGPEATSFFVASLAPEGMTSWGMRLGGVAADGPFASPIPDTVTGNVVFVGYGFFPLDFGGGPITHNPFLAELTAAGAHLLSEPLIPASPAGTSFQVHDVVMLADGRIRALITANGPLVFGDTTLLTGPADASASVLLAFDAAGMPVTATAFGAGILERGHLAVGENGVAVAGGPVGAASTPTLMAIAKDGAPLFTWTLVCDDPMTCNISGIGVDGAGNVIATGEIRGVTDLGGGPVGAPNEYSVFVVSLDPGGAHRWSRVFTEMGATVPVGTARRGPLAMSAAGDIVIAGQLSGTTDLGTGPVTSNGETDAFVVSLSGDGTLRWARAFGGAGAESTRSITVDAAGRVRVAGMFRGSFDLGCGPLSSKGDWDIFVAALLP